MENSLAQYIASRYFHSIEICLKIGPFFSCSVGTEHAQNRFSMAFKLYIMRLRYTIQNSDPLKAGTYNLLHPAARYTLYHIY